MKELIEKYFEGQTSLEEEAQLRRYFNSGEVEESLRHYTPLFQHFQHERERNLSGDFDKKLVSRLERSPKTIPLRPRWHALVRIAAIGALLFGAYFLLQRPVTPAQPQAINWEKYEINDEQQAYEETVKALKLLSTKLNRGTQKATDEVEKIEKVTKYFEQ